MDWEQAMKRRAIEQGMFFGLPGDPGLVAHLVALWDSCSECREAITRHVVDAERHKFELSCHRRWSEVRIYPYDDSGRVIHAIDTTCDHSTHGETHWDAGHGPSVI